MAPTDDDIQRPPTAADVAPVDDDLPKLTERIKARIDRLDKCAGSALLENGRDLLRVKELVGHGNFGPWCERELETSKSAAEKAMRVAKVLGPYLESVTITNFPKTLAYTLAAGNTPKHVRDEFVPRIAAGEDVAREVKAAIEKHHAEANAAKREIKDEAQACTAKSEGEVTQSEEASAPAPLLEPEQPMAACPEAIEFIIDRIGTDLPKLVAILDAAEPGAVFTPVAEQLLRERASTFAVNVDSNTTKITEEHEDGRSATSQISAFELKNPKTPPQIDLTKTSFYNNLPNLVAKYID